MFDEPSNSFPFGCRVVYDGESVLTRCLWKSAVAEVGILARDDGRMAYFGRATISRWSPRHP
jgi:hypothetical protein